MKRKSGNFSLFYFILCLHFFLFNVYFATCNNKFNNELSNLKNIEYNDNNIITNNEIDIQNTNNKINNKLNENNQLIFHSSTEESSLVSTNNWNTPRNDELVAVGVNGDIWGVDGQTGEINWHIQTNEQLFSFSQRKTEDEEEIILIPSPDGHLYTIIDNQLQKLGLSVKDLLNDGPLYTDDGYMWIASKYMQMWALDSQGNILRYLSFRPSEKSMWDFDDHSHDPLLPSSSLILTKATYFIQSIHPITGVCRLEIFYFTLLFIYLFIIIFLFLLLF